MLEERFAEAREALAAFVAALPAEARLVCLHDVDADGLAAGVVWQRVLERAGRTVVRLHPDRERNAWTVGNKALVASAQPDALFVLDLGSQANPVLPGVPTCFIDHHRPEGSPPGSLLISGFEWEPIPNTSWMMHELGPALGSVEGLDWVAVLGTISDLGEKAPWPMIAEAKKRYGAKWLKEATVLINAPRRSSGFQVEAAARALLAHETPRELCESPSPDVEELRRARAEVAAELEEAKKAAPKFAGRVALIRIHSPCQVHPLIAQVWRGRLPKYYVLVANSGYIPGRVSFSARGAGVLDFLKSVKLSEGEDTFGHGHDAASGGSLATARWNEFLGVVGFGEEVMEGDNGRPLSAPSHEFKLPRRYREITAHRQGDVKI